VVRASGEIDDAAASAGRRRDRRVDGRRVVGHAVAFGAVALDIVDGQPTGGRARRGGALHTDERTGGRRAGHAQEAFP